MTTTKTTKKILNAYHESCPPWYLDHLDYTDRLNHSDNPDWSMINQKDNRKIRIVYLVLLVNDFNLLLDCQILFLILHPVGVHTLLEGIEGCKVLFQVSVGQHCCQDFLAMKLCKKSECSWRHLSSRHRGRHDCHLRHISSSGKIGNVTDDGRPLQFVDWDVVSG